MATTRQLDFLNRLQSIPSVPGATAALPFPADWLYTDANQCTRRTETYGPLLSYHYDALGQVTSGKEF